MDDSHTVWVAPESQQFMEPCKEAGAGAERVCFSRVGPGSSGCCKVWWSEAEVPAQPPGHKEGQFSTPVTQAQGHGSGEERRKFYF